MRLVRTKPRGEVVGRPELRFDYAFGEEPVLSGHEGDLWRWEVCGHADMRVRLFAGFVTAPDGGTVALVEERDLHTRRHDHVTDAGGTTWAIPVLPHRGLAGAHRKGVEAALAGAGAGACPYADNRTYRGGVTFSRAYIKAWHEGHERGVRLRELIADA